MMQKKTNTKYKEKILNFTLQDLEKYSCSVQPLAYRGMHPVNTDKELLTGGGEKVGDGRADGSSAIGHGGQAAISLTLMLMEHLVSLKVRSLKVPR